MNTKKKVLFIDRDGTLIREAPPTYQIDSIDKLEFYPGMLTWLPRILAFTDYELVMASNQDGLGTESFPEDSFWPVQNFILRQLKAEGIQFSEILIDKTLPEQQADTRKPNTGLFSRYLKNPDYNLNESFVIGDRISDVQLAKNLGCKAIWLNNDPGLGKSDVQPATDLSHVVALETTSWKSIHDFFLSSGRKISHERITRETNIQIKLNPDGTGITDIKTGLHFLDHMLDQVGRHSSSDLFIRVQGDLHIDEHHTIEDTAIALGEAFSKAMGNKAGMERYGFTLPMDDCLAQVSIDFGGRSWLVWDVKFNREKIGDCPTEMFFHFFKSFSDAARCNLNIKSEGENEHHKIEAIFKAFAKAIKMALKRDTENMILPTTKGIL